jgi:HPt (histidine-containing phosphotransfer) domain-containing protein
MSLFNLDLLHSISGGSNDAVKEIIVSFNEELEIHTKRIQSAIDNDQLEPLPKIMHNLKSMMGIINDPALATNVSEMAKTSFYDQDNELVKIKMMHFLQQAELLEKDAERIIFNISGN